MDLRRAAEATVRAVDVGSYKAPSGRTVHLDKKRLKAKPETVTRLCERRTCASPATVIVGRGDSFEMARLLFARGCRRVAVLDFASDSNPGGGFRRGQQGTQEESLCRRSSLGPALESGQYPIPELGALYVPNVAVFRTPELEWLEEPLWVSVIAAALRQQGDAPLDSAARRHMDTKISLVIDTAVSHGHDALVLGAWGCGAFGNDPREVAQSMQRCLRSELATVAFAVPGKENLSVFQDVFRDADHVDVNADLSRAAPASAKGKSGKK